MTAATLGSTATHHHHRQDDENNPNKNNDHNHDEDEDEDEDEQQALRDVIAELVTENTTLHHDNARLREDNHDLAEQAANYLAQITALSSSTTTTTPSRMNTFPNHHNHNDRDGESGGEDSSIALDPVQRQQQRTIEELRKKVLKLTEEKFEMATMMETLEHQLMMMTMISGGSAAGPPPEKTKTSTTRGFLPGIFFASRSISEDESVPVTPSSSSTTTTSPVHPNQPSHPRSTKSTTSLPPPTTPTTKASPPPPAAGGWNLIRHDDPWGMEGTDTNTTGAAPTGPRSSIFSGRFSDIYNNEGKEPEKVIKKPDYFGAIDKQRKMGSHRLSTAAAMVDDTDNDETYFPSSDSRKTAAATFDLLL